MPHLCPDEQMQQQLRRPLVGDGGPSPVPEERRREGSAAAAADAAPASRLWPALPRRQRSSPATAEVRQWGGRQVVVDPPLSAQAEAAGDADAEVLEAVARRSVLGAFDAGGATSSTSSAASAAAGAEVRKTNELTTCHFDESLFSDNSALAGSLSCRRRCRRFFCGSGGRDSGRGGVWWWSPLRLLGFDGLQAAPPSAETVVEVLRHLCRISDAGAALAVLGSVYLERFLAKNPDVHVTARTWRPLVIAAMRVALKTNEDVHPWNRDFVMYLRDVVGVPYSAVSLHALELRFLAGLEFRLEVSCAFYERHALRLSASTTDAPHLPRVPPSHCCRAGVGEHEEEGLRDVLATRGARPLFGPPVLQLPSPPSLPPLLPERRGSGQGEAASEQAAEDDLDVCGARFTRSVSSGSTVAAEGCKRPARGLSGASTIASSSAGSLISSASSAFCIGPSVEVGSGD